MKKLSFIRQYIANPSKVGAVLPSSKYLSDKMLEEVNFEQSKYIVEYGPGTGVFTKKILERRNASTVVVLIESNKAFYHLLKEKYSYEMNLIIIYGSAENIEEYLNDYQIPYADYIISGLPFASLPNHISNNILSSTLKVMKTGGRFVTFQYTKFKILLFKQYFPNINMKREFRNLPPAYILNCMQ